MVDRGEVPRWIDIVFHNLQMVSSDYTSEYFNKYYFKNSFIPVVRTGKYLF